MSGRFRRPGPSRLADGAVRIVVLTLFLGPAALLAVGDRPAGFGFQMYSGYGIPEATWRDDRGRDHPVDLGEHVATPRHEVDWTRILPEELCRRMPHAASVTVSQLRPEGTVRRSAAC